MEQARRDDVIVATKMLGGDVTREHGGPVRLYVAPMYGYKSLKWLAGIEVTDRAEPARLLGGPRLRHRRLGRRLERPERRTDVTATDTSDRRWSDANDGRPTRDAPRPRPERPARRRATSSASTAPSGSCTGSAPSPCSSPIATGAALYVRPLAVAIGRRELVKDLHVVAGFAVGRAVPGRHGRTVAGRPANATSDRFANWHDDDCAGSGGAPGAKSETGKFNGGQKLNAVLLSSGARRDAR